MAVVKADRLCKEYKGHADLAVKDVSFTVADGEFMVLLGPSGCGKTSILRMIAGLEPITSGDLLLNGKRINDVPAKDRDIAMVFQSYALYPHMDVYSNLAFGLRRRGFPPAEIDRRVTATAAKLAMVPYLKRKPMALSGGQRQRVALGRAIVREPQVFLFDEPLSNLDAAARFTTRNELIKQQKELGTTTIYVTHDQVEAMTMGHRICILNHGELVQIGRPLEVYQSPADTFVARFLGNPQMNMLKGTVALNDGGAFLHVAGSSIELAAQALPELRKYAGSAVIVGVRPEDLYEHEPAALLERLVRIPARVIAVEPLGAETLLMLALPDSKEEIIARVGRQTGVRSGDTTTVALDTAALHLFDPATKVAIPYFRR
ncbi:MAG TPA: ABC transporter ATP-binding protein [Terriglobia bacterium]|nr:ABC transporter ATP-binding protein [Terriglobia bacterium]